jgi:hypothetical protein
LPTAALGYEATAFISIEIRQAGDHDPVADDWPRSARELPQTLLHQRPVTV